MEYYGELLCARIIEHRTRMGNHYWQSWGRSGNLWLDVNGDGRAVCDHRLPSQFLHTSTETPHPDCACGFYGCTSIWSLFKNIGELVEPIMFLSSHYGKVIFHQSDIVRSEYIELLAIIQMNSLRVHNLYVEYNSEMVFCRTYNELADELAKDFFNIPIISIREAESLLTESREFHNLNPSNYLKEGDYYANWKDNKNYRTT